MTITALMLVAGQVVIAGSIYKSLLLLPVNVPFAFGKHRSWSCFRFQKGPGHLQSCLSWVVVVFHRLHSLRDILRDLLSSTLPHCPRGVVVQHRPGRLDLSSQPALRLPFCLLAQEAGRAGPVSPGYWRNGALCWTPIQSTNHPGRSLPLPCPVRSRCGADTVDESSKGHSTVLPSQLLQDGGVVVVVGGRGETRKPRSLGPWPHLSCCEVSWGSLRWGQKTSPGFAGHPWTSVLTFLGLSCPRYKGTNVD